MLTAPTLYGFLDELEKIASAHGRMEVSKTRSGRRPISVHKLLEKDKKGTLYKKADSEGNPEPVRGAGDDDLGAAKPPKHKGDLPTLGHDGVPVEQKLGAALFTSFSHAIKNASYRLTDTTMPFLTGGSTSMSGPEATKPRQAGEVPSQDPYIGVDRSAVPIGMGRPLTTDPSAKKPKKGDTPTQDRDMNLIDRLDQRDFTTTVTGLAQNSSGIGAGIGGGEHT